MVHGLFYTPPSQYSCGMEIVPPFSHAAAVGNRHLVGQSRPDKNVIRACMHHLRPQRLRLEKNKTALSIVSDDRINKPCSMLMAHIVCHMHYDR
jgi:hypothetical protein